MKSPPVASVGVLCFGDEYMYVTSAAASSGRPAQDVYLYHPGVVGMHMVCVARFLIQVHALWSRVVCSLRSVQSYTLGTCVCPCVLPASLGIRYACTSSSDLAACVEALLLKLPYLFQFQIVYYYPY